ncbi:hypothetical protein [Paenibacillus sp. SI8]|uniref:hypothetical protein n=1 Tax=unclassified Paenibacillus TaxID=185978 RepID=UPI0034660F15
MKPNRDATARALAINAIKYGNVYPRILREQMDISKGMKIGTNGKGAVAFRCDDSTDKLKNNLLAEFKSRGFPFSMSMISNLNNANNGTAPKLTWTDMQQLNQRYGCEYWSHGYDHITPMTIDQLTQEIIVSKQLIEANGIKCQGWAQVGAPGGLYNNIDNSNDPANWYSDAGRLISENYALAEAYMGPEVRYLPTGRFLGGNHGTITPFPTGTSAQWLVKMKSYVDQCVKYKQGVCFLIHPQMVDYANASNPNWINLSDLQALFDYVKAARDAGTLEVLTPSGLYYADPYSTQRVDLMTANNGDFLGITTAAPGFWSKTSNWSGKSFPQTGGNNNGAYFTMDNTLDSTSGMIVGQIDGIQAYAGETFLYTALARSNGAGTQKIRVLLQTDGAVNILDVQGGSYIDISVPNTWTRINLPFTIPPVKSFLKISIGRSGSAAGAGYGIDWQDVKIPKV